jgi:4a-hydroxytetrahydrobiopterin dehydratase
VAENAAIAQTANESVAARESLNLAIFFAKYRGWSKQLMAERLSDIAIQRELGNLPGWSRRGDVVTKTFQFRNYLTGIKFVTAVAEAAEAADHHPDIDIRYTKIVCALSTHSAGGITQKDLDMAGQIDAIHGKWEG